MPVRLAQLCVLFAVAFAAFAGIARALDFDDEDPQPPRAEVGEVYSYEIGTHAGCLPHRLEILSGQLPPGLSIRRIDLDTHVVEGVPTEAGTFSAWLAVRDCDNRSAETLFTFDVWGRRWGISTQSLKPASAGSPYSATLDGAGPSSDVTWEITAGSLPDGLTLSATGTISGTPTTVGSSTFTVKATAKERNFGPTRVDSKQFTLNVVSFAARVTRAVAEVGVRFSSSLVASGGTSPYTWSGSGVPPGIMIASDGTMTGIPSRAGSYTVRAQLVDSLGTAGSVQIRLVVRPRLTIATGRLPAASAGRAYKARIAVRGGVGPLIWSGSLPPGLRLLGKTGSIVGAPTRSGTFRIALRVRDALGAAARKTVVLTVH